MLKDLLHTEQHVHVVAERLHLIAGRGHVLEMEAYGETRPRKTLLPHPAAPATHHGNDDPQCQ